MILYNTYDTDTVQNCTKLYKTVQNCTKLYKTVRNCTILYNTFLKFFSSALLYLASLGHKSRFLATLKPYLLHSKSKPTFATRFFSVNDEAEQHRESFVVLSSYQSQQKICGLLYPINKVRLHPKAASASLCEMCKGKKWRRGDEST